MLAWPAISTAPDLYLGKYVASLFAAGERGAWVDMSDTAGLFQSRNGVTPITGSGQFIGMVLDKSKGRLLGPNLVRNGGFDTSSDWTLGTGWSISGGAAAHASGSVGNLDQLLTAPLSANETYLVGWRVTGAGPTTPVLTIPTTITGTSMSGAGTFQQYLTPTSATTTLRIVGGTLFAGTVDDITCQKIAGNHFQQATSTSRPAYQSGPGQAVFDLLDDSLTATFAGGALGAGCTVIMAVPGVGAVILTNQTIGATYTWATTLCGLIIVNRALTAAETAAVTRWANVKAFA